MPLTYSVQEDSLLLTVSGGLSIFQAAERKPELLHALTMVQPRVVLDLAGVDEIDTAGIQLLLLLRRELAERGRQLEIGAYSPAVVAALDLLQLHERFGPADALLLPAGEDA
ncbi:STAS domain-containing protein [Herbaspirillum sp. AP02]|uniref:STAS domain-containing protein n=1 Tax=unclassified Herbaspirillum TaxID=2624150 RepID=UPI0015DA6484|nr:MULTISPECIES: STAS domain-containing protein [unclassified Herbaspirillum]MBG7619154.1 STAS domain-containing protein [Herbaspirillum sp. AP02]NZD66438.1 STAS domain-containing protein [Herbaspirillum sp. AP21]